MDEQTTFLSYMKDVNKVKLLTPEEEVSLADRIKRGDAQARQELIEANLRLVVKIAHDYEGYGLPLLDLISEGNIGLMKAASPLFDPKKGKFSTYSAWSIKNTIRRALSNQSRTIRLPVYLYQEIREMGRTSRRLETELGRDPTDEELADELDITVESLNKLREHTKSTVSLDAIVDEDSHLSLEDCVADPQAQSGPKNLEEKNIKELLFNMLLKIRSPQRRVLVMRFGLENGEPMTLASIGLYLGVTRERVRQIEMLGMKALKKLLSSERSKNTPVVPDSVSDRQPQPTITPERTADIEHFRASPALIHWSPSPSEEKDLCKAALSLASYTYEIGLEDMIQPKSEAEDWAQAVALYIMKKVTGIDTTRILSCIPGLSATDVTEQTGRVEQSSRSDSFIREDIGKISAHFSKKMRT